MKALALLLLTLTAAAGPLPDDSIHQLDAPWTDQRGHATRLAELRGHPVFLTFGFTRCKGACPRLMADLRALEDRLNDEEKARVRFVFVSIDPEHDRPARLAAFLADSGADPARWTALTGSDDAVRELAVALDIDFRPVADGAFTHSNRITLLSPEGVVLLAHDGLGGEPDELLAALRR